jgi:hypothetical protein
MKSLIHSALNVSCGLSLYVSNAPEYFDFTALLNVMILPCNSVKRCEHTDLHSFPYTFFLNNLHFQRHRASIIFFRVFIF